MGKFYPTLKCEDAATLADFNLDKHIKAVHVNWELGDDFKHPKQKSPSVKTSQGRCRRRR